MQSLDAILCTKPSSEVILPSATSQLTHSDLSSLFEICVFVCSLLWYSSYRACSAASSSYFFRFNDSSDFVLVIYLFMRKLNSAFAFRSSRLALAESTLS